MACRNQLPRSFFYSLLEDHDFHHAEKILNVDSSDTRAIPYPMEAKGSLEDKITPHSNSEYPTFHLGVPH